MRFLRATLVIEMIRKHILFWQQRRIYGKTTYQINVFS